MAPLQSMTGRRRVVGAAALAVAAFLAAAAAWYALSGGDGGAPSPGVRLGPLDGGPAAVGKPAPDFALLDARDGTTVRRLSEYRGKVVILNWFASWCAPCEREMPDFERAWRQAPDRIVVLGVNLQEPQARAKEMLDRLGVSFPAVLDSEGTVAAAYRVTGMPTTFFIDERGIIRSAGAGIVTPETLRAELARLGIELQPWE